MAFKDKGFDNPIYIEEENEPEKAIIIACEGENTEPEYFEAIKEKLSDYISVLVEIKIVERSVAGSQPKKVVSNLENFIHDKYDYKPDNDELWVVWDREVKEDFQRRKDIIELIPKCKEKNYNIALTNPLFEFWLLLHIVNISTYDKNILYKNNWTSHTKRKRFIDKELSNLLAKGYTKKKNKFNTDIVNKENILRALEQEKLFENDLEEIIDNLGSNVGDLIRKILTFENE